MMYSFTTSFWPVYVCIIYIFTAVRLRDLSLTCVWRPAPRLERSTLNAEGNQSKTGSKMAMANNKNSSNAENGKIDWQFVKSALPMAAAVAIDTSCHATLRRPLALSLFISPFLPLSQLNIMLLHSALRTFDELNSPFENLFLTNSMSSNVCACVCVCEGVCKLLSTTTTTTITVNKQLQGPKKVEHDEERTDE